MRLLKVGRDLSCDIVLQSDKVSALHAEIIVLNNGDILLEDKNSRNGTFLMNKPIKPATPVSVIRGDAIRFGDVELMWSQIPMPEDNSRYKALYGIGSNFRNEIQITGSTISRFHATLKIDKRGKAFLQDHSKNGTTVNGNKIPMGENVHIKRTDSVVCGGVPVNVKRFIPATEIWIKLCGGLIAAAVLIGVVFLLKPSSGTKVDGEWIYKRYANSVAWVLTQYHYKVKGVQELGLPENFIISPNGKVIFEGGYGYQKLLSQGTAFWVGKDGKLITNLHVVKPWTGNEDEMKKIKVEYKKTIAMVAASNPSLNAFLSEIEIEGVLDEILVVPNGEYFDGQNARSCTPLEVGDDKNIDIALLQSKERRLPYETVTYVNPDSILVGDEHLIVGKMMYTIGFPFGKHKDIQGNIFSSVYAQGIIKQQPTEYRFGFSAETIGGASGSPIFNDRGYLIGVLNSGFSGTQGFNFAIKAKYVQDLLNKHRQR